MLEKNNIIKAIELLSEEFEKDDCLFVRPEYREVFRVARLDTISIIIELLE